MLSIVLILRYHFFYFVKDMNCFFKYFMWSNQIIFSSFERAQKEENKNIERHSLECSDIDLVHGRFTTVFYIYRDFCCYFFHGMYSNFIYSFVTNFIVWGVLQECYCDTPMHTGIFNIYNLHVTIPLEPWPYYLFVMRIPVSLSKRALICELFVLLSNHPLTYLVFIIFASRLWFFSGEIKSYSTSLLTVSVFKILLSTTIILSPSKEATPRVCMCFAFS